MLPVAPLCALAASPETSLHPVDLRCESQTDPQGLDTPAPRLSWALAASEDDRGQRQSAYQVLAARDPARLQPGLADLWDSGRVESPRTREIAYAGPPLRSGQRVFWSVRTWDREKRPSLFAPPGRWEMALLSPSDQKAAWIAAPHPLPAEEDAFFADQPAPLLRKGFRLRRPVRRARAYFVALGYGELRLNGQRVGDALLDPPWTHFARRVFYATYDVAALLRPGENAAGIEIGNGWRNPLPLKLWGHLNLRERLPVGPPCAWLQLAVEYDDGSAETIVTDGAWKTHDGPTRRNSVYLGEVYDARRELPGWDAPGFDEAGWEDAAVVAAPGPLQARPLPPIQVVESVRPVALTRPSPGIHLADFGVNLSGRVRLRVEAPAGTRIALRCGELLHPDGTLNSLTSVCGQIKGRALPPGSEAPATAWQEDIYTCRGGGVETFAPRFTFHGFRYVEVRGLPSPPAADALTAERLRTGVALASDFECAEPLLNAIHRSVVRTFEGNLFSVQSDCPHREKFGYGGDIVATCDTALLLFDMERLYAKTVVDFADAVRPNGGFTETAPFVGIADAGLGDGAGPVDWGTAHPLLLWRLHQFCGERRLLAEQYEAAARWMQLLETKAADGLLDNGLGDHETIAPRQVLLTGTAFYFENARLLARLARIVGRDDDAARWQAKAETIRAAFRRRFVDPATGKVGIGTQACQAAALALGLLDEAEAERAREALVADLAARDDHLTTGIFGTRWLLDALSAQGRADLAYRVATQRTFPGWGHMLAHGATTLWEHWEFSDNTFSHNHPMFGSVSGWLIQWLAGIQPEEDAEGCDRVRLQPQPVPGLAWARASYRSVRGEIACRWEKDGETLRVEAHVPPGVAATVFLPVPEGRRAYEGDTRAERARGVSFLARRAEVERYRIGSGRYRFTVH